MHINSQSSRESQHQKQRIYIKPFRTLWTWLMAFVLSSLPPECPGRKWSECAMLSLQDMLLDRVLASAGFIFFSDPRAAQAYYCPLLCSTREAGTIPQTIWMKRWNASSPKNALFFLPLLPRDCLKRGKCDLLCKSFTVLYFVFALSFLYANIKLELKYYSNVRKLFLLWEFPALQIHVLLHMQTQSLRALQESFNSI